MREGLREVWMVDTIWGTTNKPVSSRRLAEILEQDPNIQGTLYVGYPILGTPSGAFPFDAVLLSPDHGVVVFDVVEGTDLGNFTARQDDFYTKLQAKLIQYPALVQRRDLLVKITVVTFSPAVKAAAADLDGDYPILVRDRDILDFVGRIAWDYTSVFPALAGAVQALSTIRKGGRRRREVSKENSRGYKVRNLEDSIANLDVDQGAAVIETVEGVQRIRGLAGSGKTIVLALKVAYLHARHPDWQIAVTFNTRSLKGQFERLINTFTIEQTNEEPDWTRVEVLNAWGAPGSRERAGLYYKFCAANSTPYYDFQSARTKFGPDKEFQGACQESLDLAKSPIAVYDVILVDEAQDFPIQFLRLCRLFLRPPYRLVYAYDELQSLTNVSLPPPEELFGTDGEGRPLVSFGAGSIGEPKQDIILERCYRNPRPILATAHALGFGIYRSPGGLVQFFDQHRLWLDVGYRIHSGELEDDHFVSLERTDETSPKFLESHSPVSDLIVFKRFGSSQEQDDWLVSEIVNNIEDEELSPDDIIVINPDPLKTRKVVAAARAMLFDKGINTSLAGVSGSPDIFFENNTVTFTGIFRAKGNEAAMVYVINAQDCFQGYSAATVARIRNQLFTAITRSKAWVRVLGVGSVMDSLIKEYQQIVHRDFRLEFKYPDAEARNRLRIISRDIRRRRSLRRTQNIAQLKELLEAIAAGDVEIEDLPAQTRRRLSNLFRSHE